MVILRVWKSMLAFTCFTESLLIEFMIIRENEIFLAVPNSSSSITILLPAPSTAWILFQTIFRKCYFLNKQRINLFNFISLNWECLAQLYGKPPTNMLFAVIKHFEYSVKDYQIILFVSSLWLLLKGLPPAGALCDNCQRSWYRNNIIDQVNQPFINWFKKKIFIIFVNLNCTENLCISFVLCIINYSKT